MSFGRRTALPARPPVGAVAANGRVRPGGYWFGLLAVPITQIAVVLILGRVVASDQIDRLYPFIIPAALSTTILAAVILLVEDVLLRAIGLRQAWVYGLICGMALVGLSLAVSIEPEYRLAFMFLPGLSGGWVLGWFRR